MRRLINTQTIQAAILGILASCTVASATVLTEAQQPSADAFRTMRHGIFNHVVYRLTICPDGRFNYKSLDEFVDGYDVKTWADQIQSMGMEYVIFTEWHLAMYNLGPNAALDKWLPGHTAKRDLIGEIADALNERGIKLIIYAHPNAGHTLPPDEQEKVGFAKRPNHQTGVLPKYDDFINEVYAEVANRYAKKPNVLGFWLDSWTGNKGAINIMRLRETILREMPRAILLSNNWDSKAIDFHSNECYYDRGGPDNIDGLVAGVSHQSTIFAGGWWCSYRHERSLYSPETLFKFTALNACAGAPGGMAWAVSPLSDGKTWATSNLAFMVRFNGYLQPIRESVCGVIPSYNWPVQRCTFSTSAGYGATRSPDGSKEYVHVFRAPEGKTLDMTPALETFKSARLLSNNHPVQMDSQSDAFRLTLDAADRWDPLNTVIVLERDTTISIKTIANDDPGITYSGSWAKNASCHFCRDAGAYAEFTFTGTKFAWYGVKGADHGIATIFVDGKVVADVDTSSAKRLDDTRCYIGTVPAGKHTVKVMNKKGGFIEIQRFAVAAEVQPLEGSNMPKGTGGHRQGFLSL
jgi:alpha-L-fucosidase